MLFRSGDGGDGLQSFEGVMTRGAELEVERARVPIALRLEGADRRERSILVKVERKEERAAPRVNPLSSSRNSALLSQLSCWEKTNEKAS